MEDEKKQEMIDCIEMKIAQASAEHWQHPIAPTLDEAIKGISGSEIAAVKGIIKTLNLDDSVFETLIGTLNEDKKPNKDGEIFTRETISEDIALQIKNKLEGSEKNKRVLSVLSTIHDAWVNNNSNNFLKPDRNRERQFVPVELLDWKEVENDFVFLKPILQAAGIEIDEKALQEEFELMQKEYMIDNKIFSHEDLVKHLMKGSKFYNVLEGLETEHGGNIDTLLQNQEISEKMARQMEERGIIAKSREELAKDIESSTNESLDEVLWIQSEKDDPNFDKSKLPDLNGPISRREILLSKLIGKPYPQYIFDGIEDYKHDKYKAIVRKPKDGETDISDAYERDLKEKKPKIKVKKETIMEDTTPIFRNDKRTYEIKKSLQSGQLENDVKNALNSGDDELGFVVRDWGTVKFENGTRIETGLVDLGIMPKKLYDLVEKYDIGFKHEILVHEGGYDVREAPTLFRPYSECTKEQQKLIDNRKKDLEKFRKKVEKDKTYQYDKKGFITLPIYNEISSHGVEDSLFGKEVQQITSGKISEQKLLNVEDSITIPMTQRELAEIGLLPEDFKWEEMSRASVSRTDIAEADKEQALTATEIGGIRAFIDRIKWLFKGKGEK